MRIEEEAERNKQLTKIAAQIIILRHALKSYVSTFQFCGQIIYRDKFFLGENVEASIIFELEAIKERKSFRKLSFKERVKDYQKYIFQLISNRILVYDLQLVAKAKIGNLEEVIIFFDIFAEANRFQIISIICNQQMIVEY